MKNLDAFKAHGDVIWNIAYLLRGPYRPPQYRRVMIPLTVLRRLDCVLEASKDAIIKYHKQRKAQTNQDGEPSIDEEFLTCHLRTPAARCQYERGATGASGSMQNVGQSTLKNVVLPPLDEQQMIFEFIQIETSTLDDLMNKADAAITRLTEYRSALITAATTGKIDVRDVKIPVSL